mmetsp:Transcript_13367/g.42286  ORF Transcript_13367/g.42286 Transcript_13367/m.42286 type:complete len:553 (-) Transcript_13367:231-1889(-)|eukprot:CAMPEP_0204594944 /NCGR_PEP_ID=MMETSP0661-20131031/52374_1 /ASSEMBLY_ACC=CAM_ASM_000606 /TAXON_ID=109239 /ORGANISM="Alexandrium margalefi, Strain AMGDE01CS-322" /LENGTH=552 /DNA_ID=CAMNT_0051605403 /DNA_START=41 /DNA_END=1699 /DNA_ORIENTATION=+
MARLVLGSVLVLHATETLATSSLAPRRAALEKRLQFILAERAQYYNTSFSFAVRTADLDLTVAAGISDHGPNTEARVTDLFPLGSITKTYTAAAIVRLAETGAIALDMPVSPLVNGILQRDNGTTLERLWGESSGISEVTVNDLLQMRAGLNDYDDSALEKFTFSHPNADVTVFDFLHEANKTMLCPPSTCGAYSSINYMILGLVLAQHAGVAWDGLDQAGAALPPAVRAALGTPDMANRTRFFGRGPCTAHTADGLIANQYAFTVGRTWKPPFWFPKFFSIRDDSCLNGWTCGNIAAATGDIAQFFHALLSPQAPSPTDDISSLLDSQKHVVSNSWQQEMLQTQPLTVGWSVDLPYGLGIMPISLPPLVDLPANDTSSSDAWAAYEAGSEKVTLYGHGGMDYGSQGMAGYNPALQISIAIAMNSEFGMNTTWKGRGFTANFQAESDVLCSAYDAVLETLEAGVRLNCSFSAYAEASIRALEAKARDSDGAKGDGEGDEAVPAGSLGFEALPGIFRAAGAPQWVISKARRYAAASRRSASRAASGTHQLLVV